MEDFAVIDFETANSHRASACEVGLVVFENGQISVATSSLIRPSSEVFWFDEYNQSLHGISEADVQDAPAFDEAVFGLLDQARGLPIIAHNASFDMSVFRHACAALDIDPPSIRYFCSRILSKKSFEEDPDVVSFSLGSMSQHFGLSWTNQHRAESDAKTAGELVLELLKKHNQPSVELLAENLRVVGGALGPGVDRRCTSKGASGNTIDAEELKRRLDALKQFEGIDEWDPSGDFKGKRVKITGTLSRPKADYEAALEACGAIPQKKVNASTDFVVEGVQQQAQIARGGSNSEKYARALKAEGQEIEILDEFEFLRLLSS